MIDVVMLMLVLHRVDGHEVRVSPEQITSLNSPQKGVKAEDRIYDVRGNCLVGLTDGKNVQVIETCPEIQRMMEQTK